MTKQVFYDLLIIIMIVVIGVGSFQLINVSKVSQNQKETAQQNEELVQTNKQLSFDLETKDAEIQELQKELFSIQEIRRYHLVGLAKEAVKLGWQSRGMPGMTLDDTLKKIDEIQ